MTEAEINSIDPRRLSVDEFARLFEPANAAMDSQVFAQLIKHASAEQLSAVLDDPQRRGPLFGTIFSRMADRFRPDRAPSKDSAIHWRITGGPNGEDVYEIWITGNQNSSPSCSASDQPSHDPRVTLTMAGEEFLRLVSGNGSPALMLMAGKVSLDGDVVFAASLSSVFDIPQA
jgi:putative sterol carrier protein